MILLRSLAFNVAMFGSGFVLSIWGLALRVAAPARLTALGRVWARFVLGALRLLCGVRLKVLGTEYLPAGAALIAAQHQSAMDILIWLSLLPRPAYVLKRELKNIPLFGALLVPAGMIAVDRAGGAASLRAVVAECRAAIAAGRQIVIFPEGTRVAQGARAKLQPGIVALAHALDMPVIPAATDSGHCWGRKAFFKRPGTVRLELYPSLPPTLPRAEMLAGLAARFYEDKAQTG